MEYDQENRQVDGTIQEVNLEASGEGEVPLEAGGKGRATLEAKTEGWGQRLNPCRSQARGHHHRGRVAGLRQRSREPGQESGN